MKTITILIPTYNEQAVLDRLYERLNKLSKSSHQYNYEFLFINDGSTDQTLPMIQSLAKKDKRVSYVNLSRNFGKESAMLAGFDHTSGDATVIIDADLQDPPELIPKMIKYWEDGYDDVYAKRRSRDGESWFKKKSSSVFYKLLQKSTDVDIQVDTGDFRLLDKRAIDALRQIRETQRYTKGMFSWIGFRKKQITYDRDPRAAGETKWNYPKLVNLAIDGITSFTTAPLRIATVAGVVVSLIAFIFIFIIVFKTMIFGDAVAGWPSTMAVILFLGGVQLLSIGIIGEYVGRIFNEVKGRPVYFIEEYHRGSDHNKKPKSKA